MSRNKKILIITSSFPAYKNSSVGGGNFVLKLSEKISATVEPIVLAPQFRNSPKQEKIGNVRIFRFNYLPAKKLYNHFEYGIFHGFNHKLLLKPFIISYFISAFMNSMKLIKKYDIPLVHAHWIVPQGLIALLLKFICARRRKVIVTSHGGDMFSVQNGIGFILKKIILNKADAVTVVSNYIKNVMVNNLGIKRKIYIASMGIDTKMFKPENNSQYIRERYNIKGHFLLFVGRLVEKKGVKYVLRAMPEIIHHYPDTKLLIVGTGPEKNNLQKLAKELNLNENVIFTGYVQYSDLPPYFATADLFIGPSVIAKDGNSEGFGLVFAEAASSGCPVIATNFPAVKDIIIHNKTGFIVPAMNSNAVRETVLSVFQRKNMLPDIITEARNHIKRNFDWDIVAQRYTNIYKMCESDQFGIS